MSAGAGGLGAVAWVAVLRTADRRKHEDEEEENDEKRGDPHRFANIEGAIILGVPPDEEADSRRKSPE